MAASFLHTMEKLEVLFLYPAISKVTLRSVAE